MATEVGAINLDLTGQDHAFLLGRHDLPQFVRQDEGCPVLHVQVTPQLERGDAFERVDEDGDRQEVIAHRQLPAGKDRPAGDTELVVTRLALEDRAGGVGVDRGTVATRAYRLAIGRSPADRAERLARLGHRLISAQPNSDSSELDECEVVFRHLLEACGDSSEVLEFVEEPLDEISVSIEEGAEGGWLLAV